MRFHLSILSQVSLLNFLPIYIYIYTSVINIRISIYIVPRVIRQCIITVCRVSSGVVKDRVVGLRRQPSCVLRTSFASSRDASFNVSSLVSCRRDRMRRQVLRGRTSRIASLAAMYCQSRKCRQGLRRRSASFLIALLPGCAFHLSILSEL